MNTLLVLCSILTPLLISSFWLSGWLYFFLLVFALLVALILKFINPGRFSNNLDQLKCELVEKTEMLKYAEIEKQKLIDNAFQVATSKRELLSKISHEIRNPMNAMWGMASMLNETQLTKDQKNYIASILKSGNELLHVINDIVLKDVLQYSKVESNRKLEARPFNLRDIIEDVLEAFSIDGKNGEVGLYYTIDTAIPPQIIGDALRLRQILMNLTENALSYTKSGAILISAKISEPILNGLKLEFEIKDSGFGMSYEKLKNVSIDLLRTETSDEDSKQIGLSLTICKKLIQLMGGFIEVESKENEGTIFRFTINTSKSITALQARQDYSFNIFNGKKVLLIDTNEKGSEYLTLLLNSWGLVAKYANDSQSAHSFLEQNKDTQMILLDQSVIEAEGSTLAISLHKTFPDLALVLLSNHGDNTFSKQRYLFRSVITKPYKHKKFIQKLIDIFNCNESSEKYEKTLSEEFAKRHPLNILIAEDDSMNQEMIAMVMERLGYKPLIVSNGKEVLEYVSHQYFDLILMDIQMPEMDGLEATRMIRLCLDSQPIIVAMTANTLQGDREECIEAGMNDYISKPLNLSNLVKILEKWSIDGQEKIDLKMSA